MLLCPDDLEHELEGMRPWHLVTLGRVYSGSYSREKSEFFRIRPIAPEQMRTLTAEYKH
jgi:hypothetical protein